MSEGDRKICRYFNTLGGCWYGEKCKFIHILNKKPPCKFFGSSSGCRFGDSCHFSHERSPFKSVENFEKGLIENKEDFKENLNPTEITGTNNNNMEPHVSLQTCNNESSLNDSSLNDAISSSDCTAKEYDIISDIEVHCGSCKKILDKQSNESYCNLLKDHYLESFLDKEGDHVKYVKFKAVLEPGQMYWCKTCILIFEKPWSLFQHMADKAKGTKVQRWEKKIHLDWLDTIAGLMAGYDLGLFSLGKLRNDLRNLLADQHSIEEEMEAAAVTAAAMMQWISPSAIGNPWRLQQREMMRKLDLLNRQYHRKGIREINWSMLRGMVSNNFSNNLTCFPNQIPSISNRGNIKASGDSAEINGLQIQNEIETRIDANDFLPKTSNDSNKTLNICHDILEKSTENKIKTEWVEETADGKIEWS